MSVTGASGAPWKKAPASVRPKTTADVGAGVDEAVGVAAGVSVDFVCVGMASVAGVEVTATAPIAVAATGGGAVSVGRTDAVAAGLPAASPDPDGAQPARMIPRSKQKDTIFIP
jgi:hypothetical protein